MVHKGTSMDEDIDRYEVHFTDGSPPMTTGMRATWLFAEGDLDRDGLDDITIYHKPLAGQTFYFETLGYSRGKWRKLFDPFLYGTEYEDLTDDQLQAIVFRKNGHIYTRTKDLGEEKYEFKTRKVR